MRIIFEISKLLFLLVILSIAILQYTWSQLIDIDRQEEFIRLLLPAFFVLWWLMIGWVLTLFFAQEIDPPEKVLFKWFVVGLVFGIWSVVFYFFWWGWGA